MTHPYKIIVNPRAGSGLGQRELPKIHHLLKHHGLDFDLTCTEEAWHAAELASEAARAGYKVVVAAGGDGTSNEVINGLMAARGTVSNNPSLGVLSLGRGNDFAHAVGIPVDLEEAVQMLISDHRHRIDLGRVYGGNFPQGRYFGNCVGVGFDAVATIETAKLPRFGGFLSFLIAVLKTIFLYHRGPEVRLVYDEKSLTLATLMVSIMNGQRLGDGFWMAPEASVEDGFFDLCIARQVSRRRILSLIPHFLRGTQATQDEIITGKGARITIEALEGVLPAQTDGEILCVDGTELRIEMHPQALEVVGLPRRGMK
ncbi:MAG TPA: diacylglycerol kinase family protein, partial [Anaerolineales bacterium]|nr:diacylglycerol kinase family protein [Anaerolineales bacterium]